MNQLCQAGFNFDFYSCSVPVMAKNQTFKYSEGLDDGLDDALDANLDDDSIDDDSKPSLATKGVRVVWERPRMAAKSKLTSSRGRGVVRKSP